MNLILNKWEPRRVSGMQVDRPSSRYVSSRTLAFRETEGYLYWISISRRIFFSILEVTISDLYRHFVGRGCIEGNSTSFRLCTKLDLFPEGTTDFEGVESLTHGSRYSHHDRSFVEKINYIIRSRQHLRWRNRCNHTLGSVSPCTVY